MTLNGSRRTFQPRNLHKSALASHLRGDKLSHGLAHEMVVGTHEGGVFVAVGSSVEEYDGYAAVVCAVDDRGESLGRVGRNNQKIHLFIDEMAYLLYLLLVVVLGGEELQRHVVADISPDDKFAIEFVTPYILGALRYANFPFLLLPGASSEQNGGDE